MDTIQTTHTLALYSAVEHASTLAIKAVIVAAFCIALYAVWKDICEATSEIIKNW